MYHIEKDSYTCPHCGCVVKREELKNPPKHEDAIIKRDEVVCPYCGHYGMNYMTTLSCQVMVGYTLADTKRK